MERFSGRFAGVGGSGALFCRRRLPHRRSRTFCVIKYQSLALYFGYRRLHQLHLCATEPNTETALKTKVLALLVATGVTRLTRPKLILVALSTCAMRCAFNKAGGIP